MCEGLPSRTWDVYRGEQVKREPAKPIREPPTWVPSPIEYPEVEVKKHSKARGVAKWITYCIFLIAIVWGATLWERTTQTESLPLNYYGTAKDYVSTNYTLVGEKNIEDLVAFLDQIELREYEEEDLGFLGFDCSEAAAMLEWLLEGAGFDASIAIRGGYIFASHAWVLVTLDSGETVAVEATSLTQNYYAPPGIIEAPDGRFKEYTYEYREFLKWKKKYPPSLYDYDPNITFEEWKEEYLITLFLPFGTPTPETYYNPSDIYPSLEDAMKPDESYYDPTRGSFVTKYYPISEWDWWNVYPYYNMEPFSEWD